MSTRVVFLCVLIVPYFASAQDKKEPKIDFRYDPPAELPKSVGKNSLCENAPATGGKSEATDKTLRGLLGPNVRKITVHYHGKRWDAFDKVRDLLETLLAAKSQDRAVFRYQPWAEAAPVCIIATIEYKNGKGELEIGGIGGHLCFQDEHGVHWWTRFPQPLLLLPKK